LGRYENLAPLQIPPDKRKTFSTVSLIAHAPQARWL
jgi:hypothetical protein